MRALVGRAAIVVLVVLLAGACTSAATTPAASVPANVGSSAQSALAIATAAAASPDPICTVLVEPIVELGRVEAAVRAGNTSGAAGDIAGLHQFVLDVAQELGPQTSIGAAGQGLADALADLQKLLAANAGSGKLVPQLAKVDAAVAAITSACTSG